MSYCSNCGEKLEGGTTHCQKCGADFKSEKKQKVTTGVKTETTGKNKKTLILAGVILLALFGFFGIKKSGLLTPKMEQYAGMYMKQRSGSLPGDHREKYSKVPLDPVYHESYIELTEDGVYKSGHVQRFTDTNELYAKRLGVRNYEMDGNEVKRNRDLYSDEITEYIRLYLDEDGDYLANRSRVAEYMDADAEYITEDKDNYGRYELYDITEWYIEDRRDELETHDEYDFINEDGDLISVNYYEDDDETRVSVYSKVDSQ